MGVILFILMLVVLIVGHEFGHLLAAKRVGMQVPEFGIGFPPKLIGFRRGETEYTINSLPFGGFVRIVGEDGDHTHPDAFTRKSVLAQASVLVAGPGMNMVLGFVAFWIAFMVGVPTAVENAQGVPIEHARVVVSELLPTSPAGVSGVAVGDVVVSLRTGGITVPVDDPSDVAQVVNSATGPIELTTLRGDTERRYTLTPQTGVLADAPERKALGLGTLLVGDAAYDPLTALWKALVATGNGVVAIVTGLWSLILGAVTFSASLQDLSGPVGIAALAGDAAHFGIGHVLAFAAVISLNLAVLNLLPFPALDGGRLLFLAIESVRGRAIKATTAALVNNVGFALLIALMLVVTWNDIVKLVT